MGILARAAVVTLVLGACSSSSSSSSKATPAASTVQAAPSAVQGERVLREPLWLRDVGFDSPESVVHDEKSDRYLVSNVAGDALARDDRAFISRVRPDGTVEQLRWIDSAAENVELNAPKGMVIMDEVLYVADLSAVRKFDRASGRALGSIAVSSASFLHDLTSDGSGVLYASDSGLGPGYAPSGRDAILRISREGAVQALVQGAAVGGPSGIVFMDGSVWVATFTSGELFALSADGVRSSVSKPERGSLDGLAVSRGRIFVSSWEGSSVYERTAHGLVRRFGDLDTPADLAVDELRQRLLITHYGSNALSIHPLMRVE